MRDEPDRSTRHPGDAIRVGLGLVILVLAATAARDGRVGVTQADLFQLVNRLPDILEGPLVVVMQLGWLGAAAVAAGLALVARRIRLARDITISAGVAWPATKLIQHIVERGRPAALLAGVHIRGVTAHGFGFPSVHVAVAAALATAATPYLSRSLRRLAWIGVLVVGIARVYVGAHLPVDAFGGAAVGWIVGSAVHLAFGAPGGRPSLATVRDALAAAGLLVADLRPVGTGRRRSVLFGGHTAEGDAVFCRAVGRDERDADVLSRIARFLALREPEDDTPFVTPKETVEHEAYLSLLAERARVRTPAMLLTTSFDGGALLVERSVPGPTLADLSSDAIDDALLDELWRQLRTLRGARLAHGQLRAENVIVDEHHHEPWLVGFTLGETSASQRRLARDTAELLASLAAVVGTERAVTSAAAGIGADRLVPVLPLLQPVVLSSLTRKRVRQRKGLLDDVRARAAAAAGTEEPKLEPLTRVRPEAVLMIVVLALAVHVLLPQVGELPNAFRSIRDANPGWLVVAAVAAAGVFGGLGLTQVGAVREPLALGRATVVQLAAAFTNRLTPGSVGGLAVRLRFLQRSGLDRADAVTGTALSSLAGGAVHFVWLALAAVLAGGDAFGKKVKLPSGFPLLVAIAVVLGAAGVLLFAAHLRHRLVEPVVRSAHDLAEVVRQPAKALQLLGGAIISTGAYLLAFGASLEAVHANVAIGTMMLVYLGGTTVAGASPTPGGLGAVEAALVAGLTAAGTRTDLAVAGVLVFRLLTYWAPIVPGYLSLRGLRRAGML